MLKCQSCYDFKPHSHPERLGRIPSDPRIWPVAHGDLFAPWVPKEIIETILAACRSTPKEMWFFETKNPKRYLKFLDRIPENTVLSTTIETNRTYAEEIRGNTPTPKSRYLAFLQIPARALKIPLHISIEPILNFDLQPLIRWMRAIKPVKVAVGYDSLNNNLPEPSKTKTLKLIKELEEFTDVERKQL